MVSLINKPACTEIKSGGFYAAILLGKITKRFGKTGFLFTQDQNIPLMPQLQCI